jgi:hypothetical protein
VVRQSRRGGHFYRIADLTFGDLVVNVPICFELPTKTKSYGLYLSWLWLRRLLVSLCTRVFFSSDNEFLSSQHVFSSQNVLLFSFPNSALFTRRHNFYNSESIPVQATIETLSTCMLRHRSEVWLTIVLRTSSQEGRLPELVRNVTWPDISGSSEH